MEIVTGATFTNETVVMDERKFLGCTLTDCVLIYSGGEIGFDPKTLFNRCRFEFRGIAWRTVQVMRVFGLTPEYFEALPNLPADPSGQSDH